MTCTQVPGTDRLAPDVVIVFEVISPGSGRADRIEKVREYAAAPSIRRYVIVWSASAGLLMLQRPGAANYWTALALTLDDVLSLPEVDATIPIAEFYEEITFP